MKRTFISALILVIAFFAILFTATESNDVVINLETEENGRYFFIPSLSLIFAIIAACNFNVRSTKPFRFFIPTLLSVTIPLFVGVETFFVAGFFNAIIISTTDEKVLQWFKGFVEKDEEEV